MERSHKQYLNDYFQGYAGNSTSRGELYNADPVTGDARFCGTTASMCGIEKAGFEQNPAAMDLAIRKDLMLHAYMFMQSGIPVLYSGDEIAQVNDYTEQGGRFPLHSPRCDALGSGRKEKRSVYRRRENVPWPAKIGADP